MKKWPEAVLFGPTPTGCSGGFLAAAPDPLPPPTSFFRRTRSMIAFRVTSPVCVSLLRALCKTHTRAGQGGRLEDHIAE
jgi:hypothetical protein